MATAVTTAIRHPAAQRKGRQGGWRPLNECGSRAWGGDPRGVCANTTEIPRQLQKIRRIDGIDGMSPTKWPPGPCYQFSSRAAGFRAGGRTGDRGPNYYSVRGSTAGLSRAWDGVPRKRPSAPTCPRLPTSVGGWPHPRRRRLQSGPPERGVGIGVECFDAAMA